MKTILGVFLLFPFFAFGQVWTARYNGPGDHPDDEAHAIVVDSLGNVYVTGWSPLEYGLSYDYVTIKYNRDGVEQWVKRFNGSGDSTDRGQAIGLDEFGNVYVTGYSWGGSTKNDFATIKYNNEGELQWVARYDGPANDDDQAKALAVSRQGDIFVAGSSMGINSYWDYCLIKYNAQGETVWVARYNGTGNSTDILHAMALDSLGNCYVTGESRGVNSYYDCVTIKYNPLGETVWVVRYNGPSNDLERGVAIGVNELGEVWVTGSSYGTGTLDDYFTIRYDSNGFEQWVARYNGLANKDDRPSALTIDSNLNVYVTGTVSDSNSHFDFLTIKYDSAGTEQWQARYNSPDDDMDYANAIALDPSENVIVTGYSVRIASLNDFVTIKYNPIGETCWVAIYNDPINRNDNAFALTTDDSGYVYVTGYSWSLSWRDYFTIKYYPTGMTSLNQNDALTSTYPRRLVLPNPARNFVQVATSYPVQVFSACGQVKTTLKPGYNLIQNLAQGVYFVKLGNKFRQKLIILNSNQN
jgi:uncharacterized delta-60 repeat protein